MTEVIQRDLHGESGATFVCRHLKGDSFGLGFNRDEPTEEKPFPDAWCDDCQLIYEAHGGWNETSEKLTKISLLCSSCYERARIRNTRTCATCEEWHRGACLDVSQDEPYYWSEEYDPGEVDCEVTSLSDLPKTFLNSDLCAINDSDFFVRGLIELPIIGTNETFRWGV